MATFYLEKSTNGTYYYHLRATGNGEIILRGEAYNSESACKNGIESVRENAPKDSRYTKRDSVNGQFYFNLEAANGEVVGTSETYTTRTERDNGIARVKAQAPDAGFVDHA